MFILSVLPLCCLQQDILTGIPDYFSLVRWMLK